MQAQAILFTDVNTVEFQAIEVPDPAPDEVLIQTAYSCVSPGTELRCLAGQQPGGAAYPFIPGYALTGHVIKAGTQSQIAEGSRVFCTGSTRASVTRQWGGHVSHAIKPAHETIIVPDNVDLLDAVLVKLGAITYHGLRQSRPLPDEKVVVAGLGPVGQMSARLHALSGAQVWAADFAPERVKLVEPHGVRGVTLQQSLLDTLQPMLVTGADILVDATGASSALCDLIALAKNVPWTDYPIPGARFLIQGSYPGDFAIPYQAAFLKELQFFLPRDTQPRDLNAVMDLLAQQKLVVRDLISAVYEPADSANAYSALQKGQLVTLAFQWN